MDNYFVHPDEEDAHNDVKEWLKQEMRKQLDEELAKGPWWCVLCGAGGNYKGERPDEYWFPPEDHICDRAIKNLIAINRKHFTFDMVYWRNWKFNFSFGPTLFSGYVFYLRLGRLRFSISLFWR
jgi:hypothetical protein